MSAWGTLGWGRIVVKDGDNLECQFSFTQQHIY